MQNFKLISLTQGKHAIVDANDYDWLMQWSWRYNQKGYCIANIPTGMKKPRQRIIKMHRQIMNTPKGMETDHINGNGLDNRRCNLRICTAAQNQMNRRMVRGKSKYKGVRWHKGAKKWMAQIQPSGMSIHLGTFESEHDAATAYNMAALRHFREFAKLNEVPYAA